MQSLTSYFIYLTYGILGILFLFAAIKSLLYIRSPKQAPSRADIDTKLLNTLNDRREPE